MQNRIDTDVLEIHHREDPPRGIPERKEQVGTALAGLRPIIILGAVPEWKGAFPD